MFKPSQADTYSYKEFYSQCLPSIRQNNFENTRKRSSKRSSKNKREEKSTRNSKPTILAKLIQEQTEEIPQSGKVSQPDLTRNSKALTTLDDSNKENINRSNVKSLDLSQIKFNKSKVSQKGNPPVNQI